MSESFVWENLVATVYHFAASMAALKNLRILALMNLPSNPDYQAQNILHPAPLPVHPKLFTACRSAGWNVGKRVHLNDFRASNLSSVSVV